jgi:dipeptidyl aminopeptidase/acylaminoacyl peptidase
LLSPGRKHIAWQVSNDAPFERLITHVWVADLDGSNARPVATLPRGSLGGWISDGVLLLRGRETLESRDQILSTLSLADGKTVELVRSERVRGSLVAPNGQWMAYFVALDEDPAQNGLWVVRTDGTERRQLERELFGSYQWQDNRRLLIIPFRPEATFHELWEVDVETGGTRRVTDPAITPFKIANGDWRVSPDGRHVAFVESRDRNLWVITFHGSIITDN